MADKEFRYVGSVLSGVTLGKREVVLCPGAVVSLPEDSLFTVRLIAQRLLVPVEASPAPAAPPSKGRTQKASDDGAQAPKAGE